MIAGFIGRSNGCWQAKPKRPDAWGLGDRRTPGAPAQSTPGAARACAEQGVLVVPSQKVASRPPGR